MHKIFAHFGWKMIGQKIDQAVFSIDSIIIHHKLYTNNIHFSISFHIIMFFLNIITDVMLLHNKSTHLMTF